MCTLSDYLLMSVTTREENGQKYTIAIIERWVALSNQLESEAYIKPIQKVGVSHLPTMPCYQRVKSKEHYLHMDMTSLKTERIECFLPKWILNGEWFVTLLKEYDIHKAHTKVWRIESSYRSIMEWNHRPLCFLSQYELPITNVLLTVVYCIIKISHRLILFCFCMIDWFRARLLFN